VTEIDDKSAGNIALHTAWHLLYLIVIAITILAAVSKYLSLPEQISMHYDIAGQVDRYAQKSIGTFAICAYLAVRVGQGGSRLKGTNDNPVNTVEDDSHWVGGFFTVTETTRSFLWKSVLESDIPRICVIPLVL
jgi:uncharacterized membrane protein